MASSNVQYYEKQKELQDTMSRCEQQRFNLEREFRLSMQADQTSAKMKATRLQTYWRKICDDEKRAKQRNEMLIREFERIDAHMAEMNARTQRLALMKRQYEDYVARTYPEWNELMYGSPQQQQQPNPGTQAPRAEAQPQSKLQPQSSTSPRVSKQQPPTQVQKPITPRSPQRQQQLATTPREQFQRQEIQERQEQVGQSGSSSHPGPRTRAEENVQRLGGQAERGQSGNSSVHPTVNQNQSVSSGAGVYQNLPSARSTKENDGLHGQLQESSLEQDEEISQPIRSVEIQSKTSGRMVQAPQYAMAPGTDEDDDEDEETSDFATENDLPMAQSFGNTQVLASELKGNSQNQEKSRNIGPIKPELSIDGLIRLLNLVESDMREAFSLEGYYRSSWPDTAKKNDIIRHSNSGDDLNHVDANQISMVILEQITLIVRSLSEKCVLPENLLQGNVSSLTASRLRQHLSPEAQIIWDALFHHFQQLVKHQAMEPQELSAIFTPCLVGEGGSQDKGHMFMVRLLEDFSMNNPEILPKQSFNTISPAQTLEGSGSFMDDGKVPPLKFGSLLDKPLSDDESSYVKSSLPRDPTPLNETEAYKSMLSTGARSQMRRQSSGPDDTDDDVEKQIATVLTQKPGPMISPKRRVELDDPSETSSQTLQTASHVYVPTAMESRPMGGNTSSGQPKFQGVKISSDLDTDTEVDAGIFGSSKRPEDDFDFYD
ncbi:centrosomal protein kizuna [Aplysia californica]|uniref:Centrosomal protein kizuna n=1 Tax=Aplysia californica TaxID=6500 RepID=A0ABM0K1Y2_APLCA|nr:centrosomal protein kizuna [Aplysia californica]